ncbi:MAG: hypothetical protein INQ03_21780 [Candidatus Heimdallarchaeota archaeon]|nr:hypothetical protein [Candidatus Heimdallarchaeota archaeon]
MDDRALPEIDVEDEINEIMSVIKEHGGEIPYKELNEILGDKFEGVRLRLKTMKSRGLVDFDGMVPGFSAIISLTDSE